MVVAVREIPGLRVLASVSAGQRDAGTGQCVFSGSDPYQNTRVRFGKAKLDLGMQKGFR
jgi:hypothetical protein